MSVDTGIVHLATAANTPTVCIYGPTGQIFWRPYNKNQVVLQKEPCAETGNSPDITQVIEYLDECPAHGKECVKAISVEEVEQAVDKILKKE